MRSDREMLELILDTATSDARVRAVVMSGSRVNPNVPSDRFQDFDIIYFVTEVESFTDDPAWIDRFGDRMILQTPDAMGDPPPINDGRFAYLMQFADGNRIDLTLFPIAQLNVFKRESLSSLLLDKDGAFAPLPSASDSDYLPQPPSAKEFADCCNEFWWVSAYVAKGLWREQIIYAKHMFEHVVRVQLMKMLVWDAGVKTQFTVGFGSHGKYLKQYLEPRLWTMLEKTYSDAGYDTTWDALYVTCDLFRVVANDVAAHFGFEYPRSDDERVSTHLRNVRLLPKDHEKHTQPLLSERGPSPAAPFKHKHLK